jgi:hypothetical protein
MVQNNETSGEELLEKVFGGDPMKGLLSIVPALKEEDELLLRINSADPARLWSEEDKAKVEVAKAEMLKAGKAEEDSFQVWRRAQAQVRTPTDPFF